MFVKIQRYFVDKRAGCVAVRDRTQTFVDPGLPPDAPGIIKFWDGKLIKGIWRVDNADLLEAKALCEDLNAKEIEKEMLDETHQKSCGESQDSVATQ